MKETEKLVADFRELAKGKEPSIVLVALAAVASDAFSQIKQERVDVELDDEIIVMLSVATNRDDNEST